MIRFIAPLLAGLLLAGCMTQPPAPAVDRNVTPQSRSGSQGGQPTGPGYYTVKRGDTLYRIALDNGQDYKDLAAWNYLTNPSSIKEGQVLRVAPPVSEDASAAVVSRPIGAGVVESRSLDAPAPAAAASAADGVKREPKAGKEPYSDEAYARLNRLSETPRAPDGKPEKKPDVSVATAPAAPTAPVAPVAPVVPAAPAGPDDIAWIWPSAGKLLAPYSEAGNKGLDIGGKVGDPVLAAGDGKVVYAGSGLRGYGELVIVKHNGTFLSAYAHNRKILVKEGQQVSRGQRIAEMGNTDADAVKLHFEIRKQGKPTDPMQFLPKK